MEDKKLMKYIWQGFWVCLPVYPYWSGKQVYTKSIFREMIRTNTSWKQLKEMLEEFKELRNKYIGDNLSNSEHYLVCKDKKFEFYISDDKFFVWDDNERSLGCFKIGKHNIEKPPTEMFCNWIEKTLQDYCDGIVKCSDCGAEIKESDIAGRYFAGIYCKDCWNRKWKAIEANETYD